MSRLAYFRSDKLPLGVPPAAVIGALGLGGLEAEYRDTVAELGHGLIVVRLSPNYEDRNNQLHSLTYFVRAACPAVEKIGEIGEDGMEKFIVVTKED